MLEKKWESLRQKLEKMDKVLVPIKSKLEVMQREKELLEQNQQTVEKDSKLVNSYLDILTGIDYSVLEARHQLLLWATVLKKELSVAVKAEIQKEFDKAAEEIRKICRHQLVLGRTGWKGSASERYYDGYSGQRVCIICELRETPSTQHYDGPSVETYELLPNSPTRLVARHADFGLSDRPADRNSLSKKLSLDIWQPLESLLHIFEEDADHKIGETLKKY